MENKLDGVIVEIPGAEHKSNSSDQNVKILDFDPTSPPTDNIQGVQLDQDQGLRSRKRSTDAVIPDNDQFTTSQQVDEAESPKVTPSVTPRVKPDKDDDDEEDDIYCTEVTEVRKTRKLYKKVKILFSIKFSLSMLTTLVLILSKTIDKLEDIEILSLDLWKWCVFVLAILCGRLISGWFTSAILWLIEKQFLLKKKVQYFIHSLRKSLRVFIWFALILLTWCLLINKGDDRSRHKPKVLKYITRGIASTLVVSGIWILRTLFVKIINSSIYVSRYLERIQEHIYGYDVLQTLLRTPLNRGLESNSGYESDAKKEGGEEKKKKVIDRVKIKKLNPNNVSVWTMRELIKVVIDSEYHSDINGRFVAKITAFSAFRNVTKPGQKYIYEEDLLCFMHENEAKEVLDMIGGADGTGKITKKSFRNWVLHLHEDHIRLKRSLIDTKLAVKELNKFVTVITVFVLIIVWLIITKIATTEVLLFISSQFLLAVFTFGATAKSAFDSIIFVFVKHPFDIGDRCVIDGVQVVIEEVNILTTVVLRYDNEKIFYPNSVLATKSISNFNRSPDMSDCVDFDLDVRTSQEIIQVLTARIQQYIDSRPEYWRPGPIVRVREIQDVDNMKMSLYVTHTINFQNYEEKCNRLSKLILELKMIFEELNIKYHYISTRSGILGVDDMQQQGE